MLHVKIIIALILTAALGYFSYSKNIFNVIFSNTLSFHMPDYEIDISIRNKNPKNTWDSSGITEIHTLSTSPLHLALTHYSGGAHCCFSTKIYTFEQKKPCIITTLDTLHSPARFIYINQKPYIQFNDWTFAYWNASFANSPAPKVLFEFKDGQYKIALEAMKKKPPTEQEISARAAFIASKHDEDYQPNNLEFTEFNAEYFKELISNMLELIYQGNHTSALSLFEQSRNVPKKMKEAFLMQFYEQLHKSPYWKDIEKMENMPD